MSWGSVRYSGDCVIKVAQGLRILDPVVETLFLGCEPRYSYLSSSMVREVAAGGGCIDAFLPEDIIEDVKKKYQV